MRVNHLKKGVIFIHDVTVVLVAWFLAFYLRYNLEALPTQVFHHAWINLPAVLVPQIVAFYAFGLYRGAWRFASMQDVKRIIESVLVGALVAMCTIFITTRLNHIPRSVFPLYILLTGAGLSCSRFIYRALREWQFKQSDAQRVLIIGAGRAGEGLARDLRRHSSKAYKPVGFIDDRRSKLGQDIHGLRVLGSCRDLKQLCAKHNIQLLFIALPSANAKQMRRIVKSCEDAGVAFRTLPGVPDLAKGYVSVNALREVSIEDLLGREQVELDKTQIAEQIKDKVILVTGGGGSIGSELCRQIIKYQPKALIITDNCEYNLYAIEYELCKHYPQAFISVCLASVVDHVAMVALFKKHRPEIVFHAAAYKHVPMLESQSRTAARNNIIGTQIVAEVASDYAVEKFVLISTDKAVNPTNVMGATKRIAEIICQNLNDHSNTEFITVRFGNVLDSAGSVVPLFKRQIEAGGPVTVTHRDITRYFMTIPEATQLILQAMSLGDGGEIFVLDMGEPIKIQYLAEQMIKLAGKVPNHGIEIVYTGLRPGEKITEELFYNNEALQQTKHEKIFKALSRKVDWSDYRNALSHLRELVNNNAESTIIAKLAEMVPDYQKQSPLQSEATMED